MGPCSVLFRTINCGKWALRQKPCIVWFWPPGHRSFLFSSGSDELLQGAAGIPLALPGCQDSHTYVEDGSGTASVWKDVPVLDAIPCIDMGDKFWWLLLHWWDRDLNCGLLVLELGCLGNAFLLLPPQCMWRRQHTWRWMFLVPNFPNLHLPSFIQSLHSAFLLPCLAYVLTVPGMH